MKKQKIAVFRDKDMRHEIGLVDGDRHAFGKSRCLRVTCHNACHFFLRLVQKQKIEMDVGDCLCGESPRNIENLLQF